MAQGFFIRKVRFSRIQFLVLFFILIFPSAGLSQHSPKIPFPYGPMGLNSMPWIVAKEANLFEKNGLNVDMIFVGVSTVMVQSMLSGSANVAGLGGPAVVSNVLRGGDIIQIAATVPYFTQSLMVRPQITELGGLRGKKVGITDSEQSLILRFAPFWSGTILRTSPSCRWADWRRRWRGFLKGRWMGQWFLLHIILLYSSRGSASWSHRKI